MQYHTNEARPGDEALEQLGEAALFLGMLGRMYLTRDHPMTGVDLAGYLIQADADVGSWWNSRKPQQQLLLIQYIQPAPSHANRVHGYWDCMSEEARDNFRLALQQRCSSALQALFEAGPEGLHKALNGMEVAA